MGQTPWSAVINLSNSIIGVSVLAMPWCFKECGVVLAISLLLITGFVNKFSCNLLLRSSKATRKTSYETLSNHTLGGMGKLAVEVSVILLLMCTCIAFFVIIGDLGPSLVSKFAGVENTSNLRTAILLGVAVFIILPLAQKRNVESLSALSTISICFYFFFATSVFIDSLPTLISLKWMNTVEFWRPAGILKGMSIFALSMCCQPTLFAIYNSLQERTPKMMEDVVSKGVNLVAFVYMSIGFFGYITYYQEGIKGDILLNQPTSMVSDGLKLFFALSVALSFPLCVFPCRASIFSLLFPNADSNPITGMTYIPPTMFRVITVVILGITLTIAILVPNVEVVLSLTGSTMGSLACFILPALIYQHTVGVPARFMPKVLLIIGFCFMLVSTYDNIRPAPQDHRIPAPVAVFDKLDKVQIEKLDEAPVDKVGEKQDVGVNKAAENMGLQGDDVMKDKDKEVNVGDIMAVENIGKDTGEKQPRDKDKGGGDEKRQEPPIPHAPVEDENKDKVVEDIIKVGEEKKEKEDKDKVEVEIPVKKVEKEGEVEEAPKEKEKKIAEEGKEEEGEKEAAEIVDDGAAAKKESKEKEAVEEAEEKLKAQEEKQEIQEKKLEELQARQVIQERLIVKQAEELDQLRKEHEEEKQKDEALQNAAAQLVQAQAAQQAMGQVPQQPAVGGLQQPAGPGVAVQPVQPVAGGQQVGGQPVVGQVADQQVLGQLGVQQPVQPLVQGAGQLPVGQAAGQLPVGQAAGQLPVGQVGGQPVMGQPAGQLPLGQAAGQLPVAQQAVGQLPVAQQPVAQLPVGQDVGQLPVGQGAGQLPLGQVAVQPLPGQQLAGQGQQPLQGQLGQQQMAAGQQVVQVGMQPLPKMVSMFPQGAGGMGQNLAVQQGGGGGVGAQHAGIEGINPVAGMGGVLPQQQQQQQLMQGGVGQQGVLLDGMLPAGGGDGALRQANVMQQQQQFQANVAQQNPLALQQQQQQQQLLQQQQQEQLVMQQQQVPVQQNQQQLPQQGVVGAGDGMARAGFADMNQPQGDAVVVEGGIPQQPQHLEPADKMVKTLDKDAILEPGKDRAVVQQRVLNQAGAERDKEGEKQKKKHKDEQKEGGKEGESDGVIQVVDEEKADEEEGMGGGNGDAVPAPLEEEGGAIGDHKKTGDKALIDMKNKKIEEKGEEDAEKGVDGEAKKEEEEEGEENGEKEPVDDGSETQEDQLQGAEDKLLENHLKMIENEEEEEFADQENVGVVDVKDEQDADVAVVMKDADDEGKIEMNQEQKEHLEKKNIRSREEV